MSSRLATALLPLLALLAGAAPAVEPTAPATLRVGLATDLAEVVLPCCGLELVAAASGGPLAGVSALRIEPFLPGRPGAYRLQAVALKDEGQARGAAARLAEQLGGPADVVFDAGADLYQVRVGSYASRAEAEEARRRLEAVGFGDAWIVSEAGDLRGAGLRLRDGATAHEVPGRWLAFTARGDDGIRLAGGRYRGRILVFLNDRGTLNMINEVGLEEYLRGVVPREMGPEVFDNLEALKAQAVAARTYTLRNLGEFAAEGYDICATPRCQVYGGMDDEHPLSDRAVRETAGEVLVWRGGLVEALYSSTCGGHTENVEVVFPERSGPYLRGVPCLEAGVDRLAGDLDRGARFPDAVTRRLLEPTADSGPAALAARFEHLALLAGLPMPPERLASLDRREVQRFVASLFDLALDARLFVAHEDLGYLLDDPPAGWAEEDLRLAAFLMQSGLLAGKLDRPLSAREIEATLFELALFLRVVERRGVRYLGVGDGALEVRQGERRERLELPSPLATFRRRGDDVVAAPLALLAGDRLTLYLAGGRLLAVVQEVDLDGVAYDRTSNLSRWTRYRSDAELAERVERRYPGLGFRGLEVLDRGVSGRVAALRLDGAAGDSVVIRGLPVRWTLDVPDTLFTVRRLAPAGGETGWLFSGRGWGHGVGMCQVGAFGMAVRGHGYREILQHYYTGVEPVRLEPARPGAR